MKRESINLVAAVTYKRIYGASNPDWDEANGGFISQRPARDE
jgi:hypothetical protein